MDDSGTGSPKTAPHRPSPATAIDILSAARELIAKDGVWTQGAYARDVNGDEVSESSTAAVCFCSVGALHRAGGRHQAGTLRTIKEAVNMLSEGLLSDGLHLENWNDEPNRTQAEVVALFDRTISKAGA